MISSPVYWNNIWFVKISEPMIVFTIKNKNLIINIMEPINKLSIKYARNLIPNPAYLCSVFSGDMLLFCIIH